MSSCRQAIGPIGVEVDLVVVGQAGAERLSGSRWHVLGDVAREGLVLCSAGVAASDAAAWTSFPPEHPRYAEPIAGLGR